MSSAEDEPTVLPQRQEEIPPPAASGAVSPCPNCGREMVLEVIMGKPRWWKCPACGKQPVHSPDPPEEFDHADWCKGVGDACAHLLAEIAFLDDAVMEGVAEGAFAHDTEARACCLATELLKLRPALVKLTRAVREEQE